MRVIFSCYLFNWRSILTSTGFILDKRFGVNQPKRMTNVKILVANTGKSAFLGRGAIIGHH